VTMRGTLQTSNLYQPVLGGAQGDQSCILAAPQKPEHPYQPAPSQYGSEHTYHSIDNNHIYHTLDPGSNPNLFLQFQGMPVGGGGLGLPNRVFINQNLDLSVAQPQVQTMHRAVQHVLPEHGVPVRHSAAMTTGRPVPVHHQPPRPTANHGRSQSINQSAAHNQSINQSAAHNQSINQSAANQSINHGRSHSINHAHTNSTSSAKKLLSGEEGEYIV